MAITEFRPQDQNPAQAPILGEQSGTFGANAQQRRNINQQGNSGRFTNLQQYIQANEANNPNARLLQREAQAKQGELGTKQAQFTTQATPIKTGFETIRSGQQFVQNALENPTQYVTPERLQQFAGYRTSGVGDIETPYNQLQALRSGLGTQQEQLASGLETIKSIPTALQNYIQSQRANPSLATRGENVLDRFLTQSTQSGQQAIEGLGTTATAIRQAQAPSIVGDIESLRTQAQAGPLSSADVRNLITSQTTPEEEYVRGITPGYVAGKVGVDVNQGKAVAEQLQKYQTSKPILEAHNAAINELNNAINFEQSFIDQADKTIAEEQAKQIDAQRNRRRFDDTQLRAAERTKMDRQNQINRFREQIQLRNQSINPEILALDENSYQQFLANNQDTINKYNTYLNQINKTREQYLQENDPTRLSRIQALQQLAGTTQFNPLLQTRLS
ncbi:hypothetical protein EBZ38_11505 [bacterium]|nr:hypothetical protein [bacterium]